MNSLMSAADAARYKAKSRGKSLCVIAGQRSGVDARG
jgi:hypothetical protein